MSGLAGVRCPGGTKAAAVQSHKGAVERSWFIAATATFFRSSPEASNVLVSPVQFACPISFFRLRFKPGEMLSGLGPPDKAMDF